MDQPLPHAALNMTRSCQRQSLLFGGQLRAGHPMPLSISARSSRYVSRTMRNGGERSARAACAFEPTHFLCACRLESLLSAKNSTGAVFCAAIAHDGCPCAATSIVWHASNAMCTILPRDMWPDNAR